MRRSLSKRLLFDKRFLLTRRLVLTAPLVVGLTFASTPSSSTATLELDVPPQAEITQLEELASWIDGDLDGRSFRQLVDDKTAGFDLFRSYHSPERSVTVLRDVPFGESIGRVAEHYEVDPLLVAAVVEVESRFRPSARSHRGATGLMQVMPATAGMSYRSLQDPDVNLDAGVSYLSWLLDLYDGDLVRALAAYNAGPTNVRRYDGVPPFRETRNYVEKVLRIYVAHHRQVWEESPEARYLGTSV